MDANWLRVGGITLHVPTIAYVEELEATADSPSGSPEPHVQVGFMGGAFRVLHGGEAKALLAWVDEQARSSSLVEIPLPASDTSSRA